VEHVDFLIVGAGVSGLTAALTALSKYPDASVVLTDSAAVPGGLLRSVDYSGSVFDMGTHIPECTGSEELNSILFSQEFRQKSSPMSRLIVGNYFGGTLSVASQFPNLMYQPWFSAALYELLSLDTTMFPEDNSLQQLIRKSYGAVVEEKLFAPLMKKFTGLDTQELATDAARYFGLARLIYGNSASCRNLKSIAHIEPLVAYANDNESLRQSQWFYPNAGYGIGLWIETMLRRFEQAGGKLLLSCKTQGNIKSKDDRHCMDTDLYGSLSTKNLIWTVPNFSGLEGFVSKKPLFCSIMLFHFTIEYPVASDLHYFYCFDDSMKSFRITLYDNIQANSNRRFRLTVEAILPASAADKPTASSIATELELMNLIKHRDDVHIEGYQIIENGFPISTLSEKEFRVSVFNNVKANNANVVFAGRADPGIFFMKDVLTDTYEKVKLLTI